MQTKNQINSKGKRHGYWEYYYFFGNIMCKGNYKNGEQDGYWEWYCFADKLWFAGNYKNGKEVGYWVFYYPNGSVEKTIFYAN